ncbi:MAG: SAM-dependent methyltransferase [Candidatus Krumholzibacteriia bacterium]
MSEVNCLACGSDQVTKFLRLDQVPVFCNVLWETAAEAKAAPCGDLDLGICSDCGHVFNVGFDPELVRYAEGYENSLHHSPRFQQYAEELAADLQSRHELTEAHVVEIACGQGDFLKLVCSSPKSTGSGFDPSFRGEPIADNITIYGEYFGVRPMERQADLVCCRHALEHIDEPAPFLKSVRAGLPADSKCVLFFEMPNSLYSLRDGGVWDFIYEHVSYFCATSLIACFERAGLRVSRTWETFAGQFLCIEAHADGSSGSPIDASPVPSGAELTTLATGLSQQLADLLEEWKSAFQKVRQAGGKVAIWGAGSKGVTFLNLMGEEADICIPVDINPQKRGLHVPGTGHKVVAPAELTGKNIQLVLVMNPIYATEIAGMVSELGIEAKVVGV